MRCIAIALLTAMGLVGCRDNSPPTAVVPPPPLGRDTYTRDVEPPKPLPQDMAIVDSIPQPPPQPTAPPAPAPAASNGQPAEARAFVGVYNQVGRPRLVVYVNRTLDGQVIAGKEPPPAAGPVRSAPARIDTTAPGLKAGQYDEQRARDIDLDAIESQLADWMSCGGKVTVLPSSLVRQKLSAEQVKELESGRPSVIPQIAKNTEAAILIQVQVKPMRQTEAGIEIRLVAEAIDLWRGDSLARTAADTVPPLDKAQLQQSTQVLAGRIMDGIARTWTTPRAGAPDSKVAPPPPPTKSAPAPAAPAGGSAPEMPRLKLPYEKPQTQPI